MKFLYRFREILSYGKDTLSAIRDLTDNDNFRSDLVKAGGLLALVSIAIDVTDKIIEQSRAPKVKAYNRLSRYVLIVTKETLMDFEYKDKIDETLQKQLNLQGRIKKSFDKSKDRYHEDLDDWNSYVIDHPAIKKFKESIKNSLRSETSHSETNDILRRIDSDLRSRADNDTDCQSFYDWWRLQSQYQELFKYLRFIEELENAEFNIPNNKKLKEYYVENDVITGMPIDTLNYGDEEVRNNSPCNKGILDSIRDFVANKDQKLLIIAGSFGVGKSTAAKMISAELAREYLGSDANIDIASAPPVPILLPLRIPGLKTEDGKFSLEHILDKIIAPEDSLQAKETPLLIIFDGLEKYKDPSITIGDKIEQLRKSYRNLKVIITTTLDQNLLVRQGINVSTYSRLLSFNHAQLDEFFKKYEVKIGEDILTVQSAINIQLPIEEMFRPLFAWIFSYLETTTDSGVRIVSRRDWTPKMKKAWIYMHYFHRLIKGKPREAFTNIRWKESYLQEKKMLRAIAVLKQTHKKPHEKPIESNIVEAEIRNFDIQSANSDINSVERSHFLSLQYGLRGRLINFVHGSFSDYLLAEYYIDSMLHNKRLMLNTGIPNKQTIEFLDGLLDLLNIAENDVEASIISSSEMSEKTSLLASFDYYDGRERAKEELISATSDSIESEYIIFPLLEANPDKKQDVGGRRMKQDSTNNDFEQLWIHRWVSLFILNKLIANDKDRRSRINENHKDAIRKLINHSGNFVPSYLKNLKNVDLSHSELPHANLSGADLSGADLSGANLFRADLSGADLSEAKLCGAELTDINMSDAKLSEAKLSHCVLSRGNLSDSNFYHADLSYSKLSYAILSYANLSRSVLSHAKLLHANLSDANLSHAIISEADLSYANLSNATLACAQIENCKECINLVCYGTDFNSVKSSAKFLEYLESNRAKNIVQEHNKIGQDMVPPVGIIKIPADDPEDVPTWASITVDFRHAISKNSIKSDSFGLFENGSRVKGIVSLISPGHKTAVFLPSDILKPGTKYTAIVTRDVKDYAGKKIQSPLRRDFTTSQATVCERLPILGIIANGDDGNIPRNAIDNNDLNTRWTRLGIGSWVQVDLGEEKDISNLQIAWFKGDRRKYTFKITFSKDRELKNDVKESDKLESNGYSLSPENYEVKDHFQVKKVPARYVRARYVRITVNGNSDNNWASITHISVYGQKNVNTPATIIHDQTINHRDR